MTYSPNMNLMTSNRAAYAIDQREIERVLRNLMARQSGGFGASATTALNDSQENRTYEGWQRGQLDFARRIAQISLKHAARQKEKFCWKHHSIGLLRRLALVVMVATILAAQYI